MSYVPPEPGPVRPNRIYPHALAGLALMAAVAVSAAVERARQVGLQAELRSIATRIETRIDAQTDLLRGLRAFVVASDLALSRDRIVTFLNLAGRERRAGMQGIGIALHQEAGETGEAERLLAGGYGRARAVWPATDQPDRFPIVILEPGDDRNLAALGYDMYSEPVRRDAMDRAWRTGAAAASGPVELVQEITEQRQAGFLIYLPVMTGDVLHSFVYAPYRIGDLMEAVLHVPVDLGVRALVRYESASGPILFSDLAENSKPLGAYTISVADQTWWIGLAPADEAAASRILSFMVLLPGALMALLLQALLVKREEQIATARRAAAETARVAQTRQMLLLEMKHRLKNVLARVGSLARLGARGAADKDAFLEAFERQLRALAAAQDLLTASSGEALDMEAVVRAELASAGAASDRVALEGGALSLDETQVQAIGLVVHELLTNSLKYGALAAEEGSVLMRWEAQAGRTRVDWLETGSPQQEALPQPGFGSQLLDAMILGQLGGTLSRSFEDGALRLEFSFPNRTSG